MLSFLPPFMAAYVFVLVALVAGRFFVKYFGFGGPDAMRWSTMWIVITTAAFFGQHYAIFALVVLIVSVKFFPHDSSDKIAYYAAILPVLPMFIYRIPGALGINYFFTLSYPRLLTLFVLLPILLKPNYEKGRRREPVSGSKADIFVILYTLWASVISMLHAQSLTDGLRMALIDNVLFLAVPYFAVSRALKDLDSIRKAIIGIMFSAIMVCFIAMFEQYADWWFYQFVPGILKMEPLSWLANISYSRWGFIRVKSSIEGGIGYFAIVALGCLMFLSTIGLVRRWLTLSCAVIVLATLFFTGSRGAWLAAIIFVALYFKFQWVNSPFKLFLVIVGGIASLELVDAVLAWYQDEQGTFDYRRQLLIAAIPVILENFFFGVQSLEATGRLEHLRQGEGIIDIVNTYLMVGLASSGLTLLFFVAIFVTLLFETVAVRPSGTPEQQMLSHNLKRLLICVLLMTMVLIATVSPTGYLPTYNWLIFALAAAYGRVAKQSARVSVAARRRIDAQQRSNEDLQKT